MSYELKTEKEGMHYDGLEKSGRPSLQEDGS